MGGCRVEIDERQPSGWNQEAFLVLVTDYGSLGSWNPGSGPFFHSALTPSGIDPLKSALSCVFKGWPIVSPIPSLKVQENWSWGQSTNSTWSVCSPHAGLEKEKDFASYVLNKVIEISKLSGMYYDETRAAQGIGPDKIKKNDAKSVMETTCKAFMLISEEKNIALGKYCFPYIYPKALPEEDRNSQA